MSKNNLQHLSAKFVAFVIPQMLFHSLSSILNPCTHTFLLSLLVMVMKVWEDSVLMAYGGCWSWARLQLVDVWLLASLKLSFTG